MKIKIVTKAIGVLLVILCMATIVFAAGMFYQQPYSPSQALYKLELSGEVEFSKDKKSVFIYKNNNEMPDFYKAVSVLEPHYVVYVIDLSWEKQK